jgi:thiol-disulfide isomerase/thioredoxin
MRPERSDRSRIAWALALLVGCGGEAPVAVKPTPVAAKATSVVAPRDAEVGYDLRRLRPRDEETLAEMFDRQRAQAAKEGKRVAALFSADWCEPCRLLETELGNRHPAQQIGDVRILELKEEDWAGATRMDEFEALRKRWTGNMGSYPLLLLLDEAGKKREEMKEAKDRLSAAGAPDTLAHWFADTRPPA